MVQLGRAREYRRRITEWLLVHFGKTRKRNTDQRAAIKRDIEIFLGRSVGAIHSLFLFSFSNKGAWAHRQLTNKLAWLMGAQDVPTLAREKASSLQRVPVVHLEVPAVVLVVKL